MPAISSTPTLPRWRARRLREARPLDNLRRCGISWQCCADIATPRVAITMRSKRPMSGLGSSPEATPRCGGGLRPGEVLGLHLTDIAYGRRRVTVRVRFDHARGVRSKSRTERVVDLHEAATLETVSAYVMHERPHDTMSPILFLVGGNGPRRHEALSYAALVRLFARASDRAGIRTPSV